MSRYSGLDFLKFIANVGILFHHYQQVTHFSFNYWFDFYYGYFYWGYLVELFMCISGFFAVRYIEKIADGLEYGRYIIHKLKRFVPMLCVCMVAYLLVICIYHHIVPYEQQTGWAFFNEPCDLWKFLTCVLCMNFGGVVNPEYGYIGAVTWTVSVLIICYTWLYVIVYLTRRLKVNTLYFFCAMIFIGIAIQEYRINAPFFNEYSARGYCAFFSGLLLALYMKKHDNTFKCSLIVRTLIFLATTVLMIKSSGQQYLLSIIVFPMLISIFTDRKIERLFSLGKGQKVWEFLGNVGFEMYIWHPVVIATMLILVYLTQINYVDHGMIKMLLYALICFFVGVAVYVFVERPLKKMIK